MSTISSGYRLCAYEYLFELLNYVFCNQVPTPTPTPPHPQPTPNQPHPHPRAIPGIHCIVKACVLAFIELTAQRAVIQVLNFLQNSKLKWTMKVEWFGFVDIFIMLQPLRCQKLFSLLSHLQAARGTRAEQHLL